MRSAPRDPPICAAPDDGRQPDEGGLPGRHPRRRRRGGAPLGGAASPARRRRGGRGRRGGRAGGRGRRRRGEAGVPGCGSEPWRRSSSSPRQKARETLERLKDTHDRYLRAVADLENYRKRAQKERDEVLRYGNEKLLKDLFPVVDGLDRALAATLPGDDPLGKGVRLVRATLRAVAGPPRRDELHRPWPAVRPGAPRGPPAGRRPPSSRPGWWCGARARLPPQRSARAPGHGRGCARARRADGAGGRARPGGKARGDGGERDEQGHRDRPGDDQQLRLGDGGRRGGRHPQQRGLPHHAVDGGVHRGRGAAGGADRQAAGHHQPGVHGLRGEAAHRPQVRGPGGEALGRPGPVPDGRGRQRRRLGGDRRQAVLALRAVGHDPGEDEADRRGLPGRAGHRGDRHLPGLLQRRPAPGHQGRRPHRRPQRPAHHQRADRGGPGLRHRQAEGRRPRRRWRSTTWAAAPSTSPSWS